MTNRLKQCSALTNTSHKQIILNLLILQKMNPLWTLEARGFPVPWIAKRTNLAHTLTTIDRQNKKNIFKIPYCSESGSAWMLLWATKLQLFTGLSLK